MRPLDLTGKTFNRLTAMWPICSPRRKEIMWLWCCSCGNLILSMISNVKRNNTKSCGCLRREISGAKNRTHGCSGQNMTPEYRAYRSAWARCNNPNVKAYPRYGGRGVQFKFSSFEEFLAHVGPKPFPKHSLDRIDPYGNYEAGNVRWADGHTQRINRRKQHP